MSGPLGAFLHPPGALSRSGVLDVGLKCAHSCRFCYYSFMAEAGGQHAALREAAFRSADDCLAIIDGLAGHGLLNFDVTGGEPTMHPALPDMVRRAAKLGLGVRIITLGQFLSGPRGAALLAALLEAGTTDFLFSLHSATEEGFRRATGGSLRRVLAAMDALDAAGFQYCVNTVVHSGNVAELPAIAALAARHGAYHHNFIVFNAYYRWNSPRRVAGLQASYAEMAGPLREAAALLSAAGVAVTVRYLPLCAAPSLARHVVGVVGVHHDPHEWMNRAGHVEDSPAFCAEPLTVPADAPRDVYALLRGALRLDFGADGTVEAVAQRGDAFKVFPPACRDCAAMPYCDGLDPKYLLLHGGDFLRPFAAARGAGPLLSERLAYLPAFAIKTAPGADMLRFVGRLAGREPFDAGGGVSALVGPGPDERRAATRAALLGQAPSLAEILDCGRNGTAERANDLAARARGSVLAYFPAGSKPPADLLRRCLDLLAERPERSLVRWGPGPEPDFLQLLYGDRPVFGLVMRREAWEDAGGLRSGLGPCLLWDFRVAAAAAGHASLALDAPGGDEPFRPGPTRENREFPLIVRRSACVFSREMAAADPAASVSSGAKEGGE